MKVLLFLALAICGIVAQDSATLGGDISNLDFQNIIGGPLTAAIKAQALAAATTVDFINEIAFDHDSQGRPTNVRTVTFLYSRQVNGTTLKSEIDVPFLTLIPIPYIEITEVQIHFTVKMNQAASTQRSAAFGDSWNFQYGGGDWNFKAGVSYQATDAVKQDIKREYSLDILVHARQTDIPRGMSRVMDWMEKIIVGD